MTLSRSAFGNITFNLISIVLIIAICWLYGSLAGSLAVCVAMSQRYALHFWVSKYGLSLR